MNVREVISLLGELSIGIDNVSDSEQAIFLKYVNLAYAEIMRKTFLTNPLIPVSRQVIHCTDGQLDMAQLASLPFIIKSVYTLDRNIELEARTIDFLQKIDPTVSQTGIPQYWSYNSNQISVYPLYTDVPDGEGNPIPNIGVLYVAMPPLLTIDNPEQAILFPPLYHPILVDGASYYLFQSETGFKNMPKSQEAMARWEGGKNELYAYLRSLAGQKNFSTYSPV